MKKYTQLSKVEALQLLIDNNGNAVGGMAFRDHEDCTWRITKLIAVNCDQNSGLHFSTPNATYYQCAKVEEVAEPNAFEVWLEEKLKQHPIVLADYSNPRRLCREAFEAGELKSLRSFTGHGLREWNTKDLKHMQSRISRELNERLDT